VKEIPVLDFLPRLNPTYVHLCAWDFRSGPIPDSVPIHMDYFEGKITKAWDELRKMGNFQVFHRGDQCNPFINLADLIIWLTDKRLYRNKLKLDSSNLESVWDDFDGEVKGIFLGDRFLDKMAWVSDDMIDTNPFLSRPTVFIVYDKPKLISEAEKSEKGNSNLPSFKEKAVGSSSVVDAALNLAYSIDGGIKFFDPHIDRGLVQDGDTMVYIGEKAKELAMIYADLYDVEVIKGKDLKNKYKTPRLEMFGI